MATTQAQIRQWFIRGVEQKATHMIIVCDTFDYDDYPVYVKPDQNSREVAEEYDGKNMQSIMEVYDLSKDMEEQLNQFRVFNY
jgi:hypothetical protein